MWKWYIAGPLIGLTVPGLLFLVNKTFGISTNFKHICAALLPRKKIEYLRYDWKAEAGGLFFVLGITIGGFIGARLLSADTPVFLPEVFYTPGGWLLLGVGGFFVGFGTRYANGCTSGHAISGLAQLNPVSLIAVICFFIGGLFVTHVFF